MALAGSYGSAFLGGDPDSLPDLDLQAAATDERLAARLATLLDDLARQLTPLERDLMARLAVFPHGASLACLAELASADSPLAGALEGCEELALQQTLVRLDRLGLCSLAPSRAAPATRPTPSSAIASPACWAGRRLRSTPTRRPGWQPSSASARARSRPPAPTSIAWRTSYLRGFGGLEHLGLRLGALTRGRRLLGQLVSGPGAWEQTWRRESRAGAAYDWGYYCAALGDLERGEEGYRRFETVLCAGAEGWEAALTRALSQRALAYVAWQRGDLRSARLRVDAALQASGRTGAEQHHLRNLALSAAVAHEAGEDEVAEAAWEQALALDRGRPRARRALWLAERWLERGREGEAIALLERVLPELEALGWAGHAAQAHDLLARRALASGRSVGRHLEALEGWVRQSGEVEIELRWRAIAAQAAGTPSEAIAHAGGRPGARA